MNEYSKQFESSFTLRWSAEPNDTDKEGVYCKYKIYPIYKFLEITDYKF